MIYKIDMKPDRSERVHYNKTDYPAYIKKGVLSDHPNYAADSHWHDDIEFIAVLSGHMQYNVNGDIITLNEGEGVFVNSRQLHFGFSETHTECIFICILFHPVLLCPLHYLENKFIMPLLTNNAFPYMHLCPNIQWQNHIISCITEIYDAKSMDAAELKIQSLFFEIWHCLCTHLQQIKQPIPSHNQNLSSLKNMISYIHENYKNKITLSDIGNAGNVGKTTCCTIFQKYINQTPNSYLNGYRISKSAELLLSTDMNISEICYETGFSGCSYFTETFRKNFGCSPREYRKTMK